MTANKTILINVRLVVINLEWLLSMRLLVHFRGKHLEDRNAVAINPEHALSIKIVVSGKFALLEALTYLRDEYNVARGLECQTTFTEMLTAGIKAHTLDLLINHTSASCRRIQYVAHRSISTTGPR